MFALQVTRMDNQVSHEGPRNLPDALANDTACATVLLPCSTGASRLRPAPERRSKLGCTVPAEYLEKEATGGEGPITFMVLLGVAEAVHPLFVVRLEAQPAWGS